MKEQEKGGKGVEFIVEGKGKKSYKLLPRLMFLTKHERRKIKTSMYIFGYLLEPCLKI
jgi:hypothetical protein